MTWHRLFVHTTDPAPVAEALGAVLAQHGYRAYDPFPGGTGTPPGLNDLVRLFVAPPRAGQVVVLGAFPPDLLSDLHAALSTAILAGWLTGEGGGFAVLRDGQRQDNIAALMPYIRSGHTVSDLHRAHAGEADVPPVDSDGPPVAVLGADSLPPELQSLAQDRGVDPDKVESIFERLSEHLFGKLSKQSGSAADQDKARAIFSGGGHDVWNSLAGQRVRALAAVLNLPDTWRMPSYETLGEAYHVHRLRQRSPRMPLMPGDSDALKSVPDALDYIPVYMGRA